MKWIVGFSYLAIILFAAFYRELSSAWTRLRCRWLGHDWRIIGVYRRRGGQAFREQCRRCMEDRPREDE